MTTRYVVRTSEEADYRDPGPLAPDSSPDPLPESTTEPGSKDVGGAAMTH